MIYHPNQPKETEMNAIKMTADAALDQVKENANKNLRCAIRGASHQVCSKKDVFARAAEEFDLPEGAIDPESETLSQAIQGLIQASDGMHRLYENVGRARAWAALVLDITRLEGQNKPAREVLETARERNTRRGMEQYTRRECSSNPYANAMAADMNYGIGSAMQEIDVLLGCLATLADEQS